MLDNRVFAQEEMEACVVMLNRPNRRELKRGDVVIHDRDAKEHRMLRVVVAINDRGVVRTVFQHKNELPEHWRNRVFYDLPKYLHDPKRFGVK